MSNACRTRWTRRPTLIGSASNSSRNQASSAAFALSDIASMRQLGVGLSAADAEKYAEAGIRGWLVVRGTPPMIRSGLAADLLVRALDSRKPQGA